MLNFNPCFMHPRIFFPVFLLFFIAACSCSGERTETTKEPARTLAYTSSVSFLGADAGREVSAVQVAVADDQESRSEGLMNVTSLPDNAGMLFIFDEDAPRSFWMASTPLPLDIIFANSDFEIVRIHRDTAPYSHEGIESEAPAKYVVEVNAGYTLRHDITEGMRIRISEESEPG